MQILLVLVAAIAVGLATPVTLFQGSEITRDLINDPRYLVIESEDQLYEVEDLETAEANPTLFLADSDATFYVFTPENKLGVQIFRSQVRNIVRLSGFNLNRDTVVIIHGWRNNVESPVNDEIKNAMLARKNVNVIVVDWSGIASRNYVSAQGSVLAVGNFVGDFLISLNNELGYALDRLTVVGHSLGAHISGNAGARCGGRVNTIVGLDPAGPLFSANNKNNRLDPTDAQYVHVIHTNDGILGFNLKMGHVDYYPNGGATQPGCGIDVAGSCAHSRAYTYYTESINSNRFVARLCGNYASFQNNQCSSNAASFLGNWPVARAHNGDYYLLTNERAPFARG